MIYQQLYENKKMTIEEKIKVLIKKSIYKIYTDRCWILPEEWIDEYAEYEELIFYRTEEELKEKLYENHLRRMQWYESRFWKSYGG